MSRLDTAPGEPALTYSDAIRRIGRDAVDSQRDYRQLIEAMGRPGTLMRIEVVAGVPAVLTLAAGLADVDVSVAVLDEDWERPFFVATGATRAPAEHAQHIVATRPLTVAQLATFARGDALHPEYGARVFAAVSGFGDASGACCQALLTLSGPGIVGTAELAVDGLDPELFEALAIANLDYPAGIDLILVAADGRIAAIPRSSHIRISQKEA